MLLNFFDAIKDTTKDIDKIIIGICELPACAIFLGATVLSDLAVLSVGAVFGVPLFESSFNSFVLLLQYNNTKNYFQHFLSFL